MFQRQGTAASVSRRSGPGTVNTGAGNNAHEVASPLSSDDEPLRRNATSEGGEDQSEEEELAGQVEQGEHKSEEEDEEDEDRRRTARDESFVTRYLPLSPQSPEQRGFRGRIPFSHDNVALARQQLEAASFTQSLNNARKETKREPIDWSILPEDERDCAADVRQARTTWAEKAPSWYPKVFSGYDDYIYDPWTRTILYKPAVSPLLVLSARKEMIQAGGDPDRVLYRPAGI